METAGVTTKITKSNSTASTLTADTHQWYRRNHSKFGIELHFVDSVASRGSAVMVFSLDISAYSYRL